VVKRADNEDIPARATVSADVWYADKVGVVKEVITVVPSGYSVMQGKEKPIWECTYLLRGTNLVSGDIDVIVR
jgi:hypothetical protein